MKQGDKYTAIVIGIKIEGKISFCFLNNRKYIILCQNTIDGGSILFKSLEFERYGYEHIFILCHGDTIEEVLTLNRLWLSEFSIDEIPDRKSRLDKLKI